jgi:RNA polymerase-binding transcription factor DksA
MNVFEAALGTSAEQHEEVLRRRLADRSRKLAEALEQLREGTYGLCRLCGERIPRRRLEALPTATLCVPCQEQREAAGARRCPWLAKEDEAAVQPATATSPSPSWRRTSWRVASRISVSGSRWKRPSRDWA